MTVLRCASWLNVLVSTLLLPVMCLDLVGAIDARAWWIGLGVAAVPLMILQTVGLHRVLQARAPEQKTLALLVWAVFLHVLAVLFLLGAVALFYWSSWEAVFWTLLIGIAPLAAISVGSGVVAVLLGLKLLRYPDGLFGLQRPLALSVLVSGGLELANIFLGFTLPFYLITALAVVYLYAWVIEGHGRQKSPEFTEGLVISSYAMATLAMFVLPMIALALGFNQLLSIFKAW